MSARRRLPRLAPHLAADPVADLAPPRASRRVGLLAIVGLALLLAAATPHSAAALASDWQENPQSRVRLITPDRVAPRHGEIWLGLQFELSPDWHVYWKNSGDAGFPPAIDLSATPQLGDAELLYPAPERYDLPGGLVAYGYGEEVVYPVRATIAAQAAGPDAPVTLSVDLGYLVCKVDCLPYDYTLTLEQPVDRTPEPDPRTAPLLQRWRDRLPRPAGELEDVTTDGILDVSDPERPVLVVIVDGAAPLDGTTPEIFFEHHELFELDRPLLEQTPGRLRFRVPLEPRGRLAEPPRTSRFAWTVTGLGNPTLGAGGAIEAARAVPARTVRRAGEPPPPENRPPGRWRAPSCAPSSAASCSPSRPGRSPCSWRSRRRSGRSTERDNVPCSRWGSPPPAEPSPAPSPWRSSRSAGEPLAAPGIGPGARRADGEPTWPSRPASPRSPSSPCSPPSGSGGSSATPRDA